MRMTPRVAGFKSERPAGLRLECMAGFVGIRTLGNADPMDILRELIREDAAKMGAARPIGFGR